MYSRRGVGAPGRTDLRGFEKIMDIQERVCGGCKVTMAQAQLEPCRLCNRFFCPDCAFRAYGRRFCSDDCSKTFFYGDEDDMDGPIDADE